MSSSWSGDHGSGQLSGHTTVTRTVGLVSPRSPSLLGVEKTTR
jgi:hypothetical protein